MAFDRNSATHASHTRGGMLGHVVRRLIHIGMAVVPMLYYDFGHVAAKFFHLSPYQLVIAFVILVLSVEIFRLKKGLTFFGQREHEGATISSFAWGAISIGLVLLFSPGMQYAIPLIWSCAFVDPLLGELRRFNLSKYFIFLLGVSAVIAVWLIAALWLGTPWWFALLIAPITVIAEWTKVKWVDDNAMMQLIPLVVVIIVNSI
jgi:hypothetical protein